MKGDQDKAIADYTEAIRLDPKYADAYNRRADAYEIDGEYDKAIADFTAAIRLNPKDANLYRSRSGTYGNLGQQEKADADAAEAERLDPGVGWLPAYSWIGSDGGLLQDLQLSPQQKKKLNELSARYLAQGQESQNDLVKQALKLPAAQRRRGWRSSPARTRNRRGKRQARRWRRSSVRSNWNFTRHGSSRTSPAGCSAFRSSSK